MIAYVENQRQLTEALLELRSEFSKVTILVYKVNI